MRYIKEGNLQWTMVGRWRWRLDRERERVAERCRRREREGFEEEESPNFGMSGSLESGPAGVSPGVTIWQSMDPSVSESDWGPPSSPGAAGPGVAAAMAGGGLGRDRPLVRAGRDATE